MPKGFFAKLFQGNSSKNFTPLAPAKSLSIEAAWG
jgi:hypothetical protein